MMKTIKMYIKDTNGKITEQDIPDGLVEIYKEKGWKIVEQTKTISNSFVDNKKSERKSFIR